jgi:hypothetical protein
VLLATPGQYLDEMQQIGELPQNPAHRVGALLRAASLAASQAAAAAGVHFCRELVAIARRCPDLYQHELHWAVVWVQRQAACHTANDTHQMDGTPDVLFASSAVIFAMWCLLVEAVHQPGASVLQGYAVSS